MARSPTGDGNGFSQSRHFTPRSLEPPWSPSLRSPLEGAGLLAERGTVAPVNWSLGDEGVHVRAGAMETLETFCL